MTNEEKLERARSIIKARRDARRKDEAYRVKVTRGTREDITKAYAYLKSQGVEPNESNIARYLMEEYSKRFIGDKNEYSQSFETQLARKGIRTMNDLTDQIYLILNERDGDLASQ